MTYTDLGGARGAAGTAAGYVGLTVGAGLACENTTKAMTTTLTHFIDHANGIGLMNVAIIPLASREHQITNFFKI